MTSAYSDEYDDFDFPSAPAHSMPVDPSTRAVIYLRVSSAGQVNTDYDPEGLSIPAQRVACQRKAAELGLSIVAEYVEPGRSGMEMTKRIAMQQMLTRVRQDKDVGFVIVYKLSRMARNRYDDAIVMADLRKRGIALISATESIDDSPVGQLMHGILATFNEYQSRESGADIAYKMGQKAKNGGTLGQARIGYLNVFDRSDGREIRTVIPDPERAELIKLAFELYASGEYTLADLSDELYDRGLRTRQTPKRPSKQVSINTLSLLLRDRYYLGRITYKDEEYPGRHEALIDDDLFDEVQMVMKTRAAAGERRRVHHHYLKGSVFCGRCRQAGVNQRLNLQHTVNPRGHEYTYFFCTNTRDGSCSSSFTNVLLIERAVEDHYATLKFNEQFIADVRHHITTTLDDANSATRLLKRQLTNQLRTLDAKESNLIDLAADGTVPQTRIRQKLREIQRERERFTERLEVTNDDLVYDARLIEACLTLLADPYALYLRCSDDQRRLLNQALFTGLYVHDDRVGAHGLKEPFASLRALHDSHRAHEGWQPPPDKQEDSSEGSDNKKAVSESGGGLSFMLLEGFEPGRASALSSNNPQMVELTGFEPVDHTRPG